MYVRVCTLTLILTCGLYVRVDSMVGRVGDRVLGGKGRGKDVSGLTTASSLEFGNGNSAWVYACVDVWCGVGVYACVIMGVWTYGCIRVCGYGLESIALLCIL